MSPPSSFFIICFFFFNDTATTEIYTLSLHDALPISPRLSVRRDTFTHGWQAPATGDRKSTRLNSSHLGISYAVFCLKKKKHKKTVRLIKKRKEQHTLHKHTGNAH